MSTWHDGRPVGRTAAEWSATAGGFLGCGFRVEVPAPPALDHARASAQRVADAFGTVLDDAAWAAVRVEEPVEVSGGWAYSPGEPLGAPWTRVSSVTVPADRVAEPVRLPWTWASAGPTAGLPMISMLEAARAEQYADERLGLWFDHRDQLCTTTAGPPLLLVERTWVRPDLSAGAVTSWAYDEVARELGAVPRPLTGRLVAAATSVAALDGLGAVTGAGDADAVLRAVRDEVLGR